jgi:predicted methyltransferase
MKHALSLLPAVCTGARLLALAAGMACGAAPQPPAQSAGSGAAVGSEHAAAPIAAASPDADGFHLIEFVGLGRGDRIADLGPGRGYSISPFVAAVGPFGAVYVRHDPRTLSALSTEQTSEMAESAVPSNVIRMATPLEAPFSPEARNLDCATLLFTYHELVAERRDLHRFNAAVFGALKPGGCYIVVEHAPRTVAEPGDAQDTTRIDARVVRAEVESVGFRFVEAADFFTPGAQRTAATSQYVLKFQKPMLR